MSQTPNEVIRRLVQAVYEDTMPNVSAGLSLSNADMVEQIKEILNADKVDILKFSEFDRIYTTATGRWLVAAMYIAFLQQKFWKLAYNEGAFGDEACVRGMCIAEYNYKRLSDKVAALHYGYPVRHYWIN